MQASQALQGLCCLINGRHRQAVLPTWHLCPPLNNGVMSRPVPSTATHALAPCPPSYPELQGWQLCPIFLTSRVVLSRDWPEDEAGHHLVTLCSTRGISAGRNKIEWAARHGAAVGSSFAGGSVQRMGLPKALGRRCGLWCLQPGLLSRLCAHATPQQPAEPQLCTAACSCAHLCTPPADWTSTRHLLGQPRGGRMQRIVMHCARS